MKFNFFSTFKKKYLNKESKSKIEHQDFLRKEFEESKKEQRKAESIKQKMLKANDESKKILAKESTLGRTRGKSTHGPRGNKNE